MDIENTIEGADQPRRRFDEVAPTWMFLAEGATAKILIALTTAGISTLPLWLADAPDQLRLGPLLVLGLMVVSATCGWQATALTGLIVLPSYWFRSIPPVGSFDLAHGDAVVPLVAMFVVLGSVVALTRTIERAVGAVRQLDRDRQLLVATESNDREAAQHRAEEVTAVVTMATDLAHAETMAMVARTALDHLRFPASPTSASIAVVENDRLRMLAVHNADPRLLRELERADLAKSAWLSNALEGAATFVDDRDRFAMAHPDAGVLQLYPVGSWGVVPFRTDGAVGLISVYYEVPTVVSVHAPYFQLVAELLAANLQRAGSEERRAAHLQELAQSLAERDRIARTLSTTLLPPRLPALPGFSAAAWLIPAHNDEVAGDFYDLFLLRDGDWVAVLGDVCGKGAEAAAVTSLARYAARATALDNADPAHVAAMANAALEMDSSDLFCTMAIVRYRAASAEVEVALAGHLQVRIVGPGGVRRVGAYGPALGLGTRPCKTSRCHLDPDETLVMFSDGLVERDRSFGEDELDLFLASSSRPAAELAAAVRTRVDELHRDRTDDVALLAITRTPEPASALAG